MTNEILKNEMMSEVELENVSGGNRNELAVDTQLFNMMGDRCEAYDLRDITNTNYRGIAATVSSLYSKLGIQVSYNDFGTSRYSINGRKVNRNQAVREAIKRAGYNNAIDARLFYI